jgi:prephenate dehydrogenase
MGAQDDFIDRGAESVLGVVDVVRRGVLFLGAAREVVEELRELIAEVGVRLRAMAVLEHEQRIETVVHQVHQRVFGTGAGGDVG